MLTTIVSTWTDGAATLTLAPLGDDRMLASTSEGEHFELTADEALDRLDALKDAGWYRSH